MRMPLVVIALLAGALPARAQMPLTRSALDSGTLVRMHTASMTVTGRLVKRFQVLDTAFRFCRYPGPPCAGPEDSAALRTLPTSMVLRLEVEGQSQWRKGAIAGGIFGGLLGGIGGAFLGGTCEGTRCPSGFQGAVAGGVGGALFFGGLGALWGAAFPRWKSPI
jgi:hypothetical protein